MNKFFTAQIILFTFSVLLAPLNVFAQKVTSVPAPVGQVINLRFSINGIGNGGNIDPRIKVRPVDLLFYSTDINPEDRSASPLATFSTTAKFDDNLSSNTFGKYVNQNIDLGKIVPPGEYQIVIDTNKTLPKLVKTGVSNIGGDLFEVGESGTEVIFIDIESMLPGDIYPVPRGDGIMDIDDYNLLAGCFSLAQNGGLCSEPDMADLDDDGVVGGVDYNLMFASLARLDQLGLPVPSFDSISPIEDEPAPTIIIEPTADENISDEPDNPTETRTKGSDEVIFAIIFLVILLGLAVFIIIKRNRLKTFLDVMLHKNGKQLDQSAGEVKSDEKKQEKTEEKIDKEYFVKKQAYDEVKKVTVLTLTDDAGPTLGYLPKNEEIQDGFFRVKGTLKKDGDKVFIDVSKIKPADQAA